MKHLNELIKKIIPQATSTPQQANNMTSPYSEGFADEYVPVTEYRSLNADENQDNPRYEIQMDDMITWLNQKGKQLYGPIFKIDPRDYEIIFKLLIYFFRDKSNAPKHGIDFQKGLLVSGPVGCGKTSLLNLFRIMVISHSPYQIISCRDISLNFMDQGFASLKYYTGAKQKKPSVFCFDDLGTETSMKYFGNETNVIAEILLNRYDLLINWKI